MGMIHCSFLSDCRLAALWALMSNQRRTARCWTCWTSDLPSSPKSTNIVAHQNDMSFANICMLTFYIFLPSTRLEEIGGSASKEFSLEKSMDKMKKEWANLRFSFSSYRDSVRDPRIHRSGLSCHVWTFSVLCLMWQFKDTIIRNSLIMCKIIDLFLWMIRACG